MHVNFHDLRRVEARSLEGGTAYLRLCKDVSGYDGVTVFMPYPIAQAMQRAWEDATARVASHEAAE